MAISCLEKPRVSKFQCGPKSWLDIVHTMPDIKYPLSHQAKKIFSAQANIFLVSRPEPQFYTGLGVTLKKEQ